MAEQATAALRRSTLFRVSSASKRPSPAERRVAETVRQDFELATRLTIAELAERAGVSQPCVTRFCRSVGSNSFGEFKIQLATTLTVAAAYLKSDRVFGDDVGQLAQSVMMNAANAVREGLDQLDTAALRSAIDALAASRRIDIYGQGGGSAAIVEDAKLRLFRLGIPVAAYVDGHQQRMSAATLAAWRCGPRHLQQRPVEAGDRGGRDRPLLRRDHHCADPPDTPLAAAAEIVIAVTIPEIDDVLRPTSVSLRAHGDRRHDRHRRRCEARRRRAAKRSAACATPFPASASRFQRRAMTRLPS